MSEACRIYLDDKAELFTLVDECHYQTLIQWRWHAKETRGGRLYVRRNTRIRSRDLQITIHLHRFILELEGLEQPTYKHTVDHWNRDTLDNRFENLRWATVAEQMSNRSRKYVRKVRKIGNEPQTNSIVLDQGAPPF